MGYSFTYLTLPLFIHELLTTDVKKIVTDTVYNYTAVGVILYCAVFQGSTTLTEAISARKYPEYSEYQRLVGRFVPKLSAFWDTSRA